MDNRQGIDGRGTTNILVFMDQPTANIPDNMAVRKNVCTLFKPPAQTFGSKTARGKDGTATTYVRSFRLKRVLSRIRLVSCTKKQKNKCTVYLRSVYHTYVEVLPKKNVFSRWAICWPSDEQKPQDTLTGISLILVSLLYCGGEASSTTLDTLLPWSRPRIAGRWHFRIHPSFCRVQDKRRQAGLDSIQCRSRSACRCKYRSKQQGGGIIRKPLHCARHADS